MLYEDRAPTNVCVVRQNPVQASGVQRDLLGIAGIEEEIRVEFVVAISRSVFWISTGKIFKCYQNVC